MKHKKVKAVIQKIRSASIYLNPDMEDIQNEIERNMMATRLPDIIKRGSKTAGNALPYQQQPQYHGPTHTTPSCSHKGESVVFEHEGKQLFASSWQGLDEYSDQWDLIIDLAGNIKSTGLIVPSYTNNFIKDISNFFATTALEQWTQKVEPKQIKAELLSLNWPDMGIAPVELEFWQELWKNLPKKTVIACMGGHGRTGSCLVALMIIAGKSYKESLEEVRKVYCKKAVESFSQDTYLHGLYLKKLNSDLAHAVFSNNEQQANNLRDIIKQTEKDKPTVGTTTGSKQWTNNQSTVGFGVSEQYGWGQIVESKQLDGKWMDRRCVFSGCTIYACNIPAHLSWIAKK